MARKATGEATLWLSDSKRCRSIRRRITIRLGRPVYRSHFCRSEPPARRFQFLAHVLPGPVSISGRPRRRPRLSPSGPVEGSLLRGKDCMSASAGRRRVPVISRSTASVRLPRPSRERASSDRRVHSARRIAPVARLISASPSSTFPCFQKASPRLWCTSAIIRVERHRLAIRGDSSVMRPSLPYTAPDLLRAEASPGSMTTAFSSSILA